jgi:uncharacterized protein (TIGR02421 family)
MDKLSPKHLALAKEAAAQLNVVAKSLPLLRSMAWEDDIREKFLRDGALPAPDYPRVETNGAREAIAQARAKLDGDHVVTQWLSRLADTLTSTVSLLETRGTTEFYTHSKALFGEPTKLMIDRNTRVLDLARHMDVSLAELDFEKLVVEGYQEHLTAAQFAKSLRERVGRHLGESAPTVKVVPNLSAKALAGVKRIRVRKGAAFTKRDVDQLLQHEALVHVATGLNGRAQTNFEILGRAHAGTTEVQEGLAVFAEIISGAMDPRRFRRLADRVIAIHMAGEGADFREVYDFYLPRTGDADEAYENTRRIFRGGVVTGGAPFTKDMVYLNGLLRVHNYMRSVVRLGRADLIRIAFTGKLDIEDLPALAYLAGEGELTPPKYMPPWAKDLRFLVSYLAYSSFLNQVKMPGFQRYYEDALKDVPKVWDFT